MTAEASTPEVTQRPFSLSVLLILFGIMIGLWCLLDATLWFSERGGFLSIETAFQTATEGAPSIDIDGSGLRSPLLVIFTLIMIGICSVAEVNLRSRSNQLFMALVIVAGAYITDFLVDEPIIARIMASYGYSRCELGDYHVGTGKSRVWFDDYVSSSTVCTHRRT